MFIRDLKTHSFSSSEAVVSRLKGSDMTVTGLEARGFSQPIVVNDPTKLGIVVPPDTFDIRDVERLVGSDRELDVIDVARQADSKIKLSDWTKYYLNPDRPKVLNVISLEFSDTE